MPAIWLTGRELAERLGESYATVMDWSRTDVIPCVHTGRRVMFNLDHVLNSLRDRNGIVGRVGDESEITVGN